MRRLLVILATLLALALLTTSARGEETGVIQGKVVNGSGGGASPAGLEVTLESVAPDGAAQPARKTLTDSDGTFTFADLPWAPDYVYRAWVTYRDVVYTSQEVRPSADAPITSLELSVYEPTSSDAAIKSTFDHLLLEFDSATGTMWVLEYILIENTGTTTYIGSEPPSQQGPRVTLRFLLPPGIQQVELLDGIAQEHAVPFEGGFADISPMPPGKREVTFSYSLPYTSDAYTLRKGLAYPTDKVVILVPDVGVRVHSNALPNSRTTDVEGRSYLLLSGEKLTPDAPVEVALSGLPVSTPGGGSGSSRWVVIGGGIIMAVVLGSAAIYARRRLVVQPSLVRSTPGEKASLLTILADLDQRYAVGQIGQEEYQRQRDAAKRRLRSLW